MTASSWALLLAVFKLFMYLVSAIAVGSGFFHIHFNRYRTVSTETSTRLLIAVVLGCFVATGYFFIQVGVFVEEGFLGVLNFEYIEMLWQSAIGDSLIFQLAGFFLIGIGGLVFSSFSKFPYRFFISAGLFWLGVSLLARSFSVIGHSAEYQVVFQALLSLHFMCVIWWIGCLFPLRRSCRSMEQRALYNLMSLFGRVAIGFVVFLLISGVALVIVFSKGDMAFFTTDYGISIVSKLLLVGGILGIALYHKLKLVPALKIDCKANIRLERSIRIEIFIAIIILAITSYLTTIIGLSH